MDGGEVVWEAVREGGGVKLAMVVAADLGRYMKLLLAFIYSTFPYTFLSIYPSQANLDIYPSIILVTLSLPRPFLIHGLLAKKFEPG